MEGRIQKENSRSSTVLALLRCNFKHSPERRCGCRSPSPRLRTQAFFVFLITAQLYSLGEFLLSIQKHSNPGVKKEKNKEEEYN